MKNTINFIAAFCLLIIVLLTTASACKKDKASDSSGLKISGKWAAQYTPSQTIRYEFKSDHSFESSVDQVDSVSRKVIGIRSKSSGKYELKNSQLSFSEVVAYVNKNYQFGPDIELVPANSLNKIQNYNITLNKGGDILSLVYICGPAEECTPPIPLYYYKQ